MHVRTILVYIRIDLFRLLFKMDALRTCDGECSIFYYP